MGNQPALYPSIMAIMGDEYNSAQEANRIDADKTKNKPERVSILNPPTTPNKQGFM